MSCHHRKPRAAAPATAPGILQPCAPNCACVACRSTWHRRKAVDRKEFFETWEFFARARGSLRGSTLVDVAGGHGLLATLFAIFESKRFTSVLVADTRRPKAFESVLAAAADTEVEPVAALATGGGRARTLFCGVGYS